MEPRESIVTRIRKKVELFVEEFGNPPKFLLLGVNELHLYLVEVYEMMGKSREKMASELHEPIACSVNTANGTLEIVPIPIRDYLEVSSSWFAVYCQSNPKSS